MRRLEKRQIFIPVLVSFLIYGLLWYGLLPTIVKPIQSGPFSSSLSEKIPLHDGESYPVSLPLRRVNEGSDVFVRIAAGTSLYKVPTNSHGNVQSALCCRYHNTDPSNNAEISLHIIDSTNTVFKLTNGYVCRYLDIPPPYA